jgi:hypothetical protein
MSSSSMSLFENSSFESFERFVLVVELPVDVETDTGAVLIGTFGPPVLLRPMEG